MAIPMPAPKNSLPPKRLVAVKPTKTGKNAKGAEARRFIISETPLICGYIATNEREPKSPSAVNTLLSAMSRPPPTRIGIRGTNISARTFTPRVNQLLFSAATLFSSSVVTEIFLEVSLSSSLNTSFTSPGPTIIWNIPPVSKVPFKSGSLSRAWESTASVSLRTILSRVAQ